MAQNLNQSNVDLLELWRSMGNTGDLPVGWNGPGGSAGGSRGAVAPFNFDYAKAATEAYGELGVYYDRLLKESKGDLDLAISRLVEDYDKGVRIQTEDTQTANKLAEQSNQENALSRGLYQKSLFAPFNPNAAPTEGMGIADIENPNNPSGQRITQNNLQLGRYKEGAGTSLARNRVDLPEKNRRYAADLEQQRRVESAGMAETRGNRALTKWQADQMVLA